MLDKYYTMTFVCVIGCTQPLRQTSMTRFVNYVIALISLFRPSEVRSCPS